MSVDKLVDSTQLDSDLTSVANAIRAKGGTAASLAFPAGFVSAVEAIPTGGGGEWTTAGIAAGTEPSGDITITAASVARGAFAYKPITKVTGDNVTYIGPSAFLECKRLVSASFPNLVSLASASQYNYIFQDHVGLVANFPKLETTPANSYMFQAPSVATADRFKSIIVMPAIKTLGSRTFARCYCNKVDIGPNCAEALTADQFFNNTDATVVKVLILRRTASIHTSSNIDTIKGLKDVYVPQALLSQYEQASNWSTRVAAGKITFYPIEGSEYEHAYADGTPIT